ncbi:MAG: hypothetical protein JW866_10485 [Ignavibacteriales bacterium]|nr:hypothetical protein [Ignavibacteriales bacterium]
MKKITFIAVLFFSSIFVNAQDIIYKTDGTEIKVKIIELTTETVKYKNFEQLQGPIRNILLSDVFMIIYEDGTKEVIKKNNNTELETQSQAQQQQPPTIIMPKIESIANNSSLNYQDFCFRGQQDASRYYTGYSSAATWTGAATILGGAVIGLIPAIACSSSNPERSSLTFPDSELAQNPSYYSCYMQEAKRIKSRKVWTMFGIGVAVDVAIVALIVSSGQ